MKNIVIILISLISIFSCKSRDNIVKNVDKNYVLLVSFDGFRDDYPDKFDLKNFKKLRKESSYGSIIPSFPSKTFPNHYSIITGMYPANHGIVDNKFFSPKENKIYSIPDRTAVQNANFYGGIPLWQWLQRHGIKTASYFWVGSEASIQGEYPTYWKQYDSNVPYLERVDQVIEWFKLPEEERPQFITLYFEFVDAVGHHTGTSSEELREELQKADKLLGEIMYKVKQLDLPITTIITSDHGMIDMRSDNDKIINIKSIIDKLEDKADFINNGMHCQVYLKDKKYKNIVYDELNKYFYDKTFVAIYKKEETPKRWNYRKHENIGDILITTKAPYYMINDENDFWAKKTGVWGTHGYDPYENPEMLAIFYAVGDRIKKNNKIKSFENIHIYPFINKIFGLNSPNDIDGKDKVLLPIIKK